MLQVSEDFREEVDQLHALLRTLEPSDWDRETQFIGWTPWDVIAHLHFYDLMSMASLAGEETFGPEREALITAFQARKTNQQIARERFANLDASELMARWHATAHDLARDLGSAEPKLRLLWFGPDMGLQMFTTARYMEVWAHSQEIYDLVGAPRTYNDRIKNIATIGVKTFGWTFVNRALDVPGPPPYVRLVAPSGEIWEWNEPSESECVRGDGLDFCHVVTQTRALADTKLEVTGEVANTWMPIAQCFAGPAVDPPKPGTRGPVT
ncbi:TIGR03084 family metal-binding protein [Myxococcota bacterium]|nr:TIGR03084 family metal-binding protein [Myxococcota bacterium]